MLSALDQVVTAGGVPEHRGSVDALVDAIVAQDLTESMTAIAETVAAGVDPKDLAYRTTRKLRDIFLAGAGINSGDSTPEELPELAEKAGRITRAVNVRALELLGQALVDMRQAPDPRLVLDLALVRLFAATAEPQGPQKRERPASPTQHTGGGPAAPARAALASAQSSEESEAPTGDSSSAPVPPVPPPPPPPPPSSDDNVADSPDQTLPVSQTSDKAIKDLSMARVVEIWEQQVLDALSNTARSYFKTATIVGVSEGQVQFELPNETHRERCEPMKDQIEAALRNVLEAPVQVKLTAARDENPRVDTKPNVVAEEEIVDPAEFEASADAGPSSVDRLLDAFPGAVASDDEGNGRR